MQDLTELETVNDLAKRSVPRLIPDSARKRDATPYANTGNDVYTNLEFGYIAIFCSSRNQSAIGIAAARKLCRAVKSVGGNLTKAWIVARWVRSPRRASWKGNLLPSETREGAWSTYPGLGDSRGESVLDCVAKAVTGGLRIAGNGDGAIRAQSEPEQ